MVRMKRSKINAENFFYQNAGISYDPKKETPQQARTRYSQELAKAERQASDEGYSFEWTHDGFTNREWTDEGNEYPTWVCFMHSPNGDVVESLGGVDFGENKDPWMSNYRRVVEAELAHEHFAY